MSTNARKRVLPVIIAIILFPLVYSIVTRVFAGSSADRQAFPELPPKEVSEECVRPKKYMRFHHMDLLKEIRVDAVRDGRRGNINFERCIECHTNHEVFCDRCHGPVNLHPDCFDCHRYPPDLE